MSISATFGDIAPCPAELTQEGQDVTSLPYFACNHGQRESFSQMATPSLAYFCR